MAADDLTTVYSAVSAFHSRKGHLGRTCFKMLLYTLFSVSRQTGHSEEANVQVIVGSHSHPFSFIVKFLIKSLKMFQYFPRKKLYAAWIQFVLELDPDSSSSFGSSFRMF